MAERSQFWTTGTSGDGTATITEAQTTEWFSDLVSATGRDEGVFANVLNSLACTGTATPIAVNTGAAHVEGYYYKNTASVNLAVATPVVDTTGGRVVLRANHAAKTVRLAVIMSTDGIAALPALTQVAGTTWEIGLCSFTITTSGVIARTDTRSYCYFPTKVDGDMIDDLAVTTAKIGSAAVTTSRMAAGSVNDTIAGSRVPVLAARQGGSATDWTGTGTTDYAPAGVDMQAGAIAITVLAGNGGAAASVTLPHGFTFPPLIFTNVEETGGTGKSPTSNGASTATTATIHVSRAEGESTAIDHAYVVYWCAIGPR